MRSKKLLLNKSKKCNMSKVIIAALIIFSTVTIWFLTIGYVFAICNKNYFLYRCIFTFSFTFLLFTITPLLWKYYSNDKF